MHIWIANPRWRGKRSRHNRRMSNHQFCISGKRPFSGYSMDYEVTLEYFTATLTVSWFQETLIQECSNSGALAMELLQSYTKSSRWYYAKWTRFIKVSRHFDNWYARRIGAPSGATFTDMVLTELRIWIDNYIHCLIRHVITYPCHVIQTAVDVRTMSNYIP